MRLPASKISTLVDVIRNHHGFAQVHVRHAVVVTLDLDMVVDVDERLLPLGVRVRQGRQRPQHRPVEFLVARPACPGQLLEGAVVEFLEQTLHLTVRFGVTVEGVIAQRCQNPALGNLPRRLNGARKSCIRCPSRSVTLIYGSKY